MHRLAQILLAATLLLLAVGVGLAIVQPGDLGGDDEAALQGDDGEPGDGEGSTTTGTSTTTTSDQTTTSGGGATTSTTARSTTSAAPVPSTTTTTATTEVASDSASPGGTPGSGLGSSGTASPSDTRDGLADTGGESLILAGLALGVAGTLARRRAAHG